MKTQPTIPRILIADDQESCHQALALALDENINICGKAYNGAELVAMSGELQPDVVITDINMPVMDGIAATRIIRELHPAVKIIAFTQYDEDELVVAMLQAGARGYLYKNAGRQKLYAAIDEVLAGRLYFCEGTNHKLQHILKEWLIKQPPPALPADFFAPNEKEILRLLCRDYGSKQIAGILSLSVNTVNIYRSRLMQKTGVKTVTGLVKFAIKNNLIDPDDEPFHP